jgi:hypothetical protein
MDQWAVQWWDRLRIQHKVWAVLLLLCLPLVGGLSIHLYFVDQLLTVQQQRQEVVLASEQLQLLRQMPKSVRP